MILDILSILVPATLLFLLMMGIVHDYESI